MPGFIKALLDKIRPIKPLCVAYDSGGRNKPTIVLLHGIAATSNTWIPLIKELDPTKNRIIALDLLGFGGSPKPLDCEYSTDDHVRYVYRTLKRLKVKSSFKLVGHSMGAIIAARYCALHHGDVSETYLLSLPLYTPEEALNLLARKRTDFYMMAYDFIMQNKDFTIKNSQLLRKLLRIPDGIDVTEDNWVSFKMSLLNTVIKQNTYDDIQSCDTPMHIIYGNLDEFLVPESIELLSVLKHAKITKLSGVNHLLGSKFAGVVARQITGD